MKFIKLTILEIAAGYEHTQRVYWLNANMILAIHPLIEESKLIGSYVELTTEESDLIYVAEAPAELLAQLNACSAAN